MVMAWSPERSGNWLFHCHLIHHISRELRVDDETPRPPSAHLNHATDGMAGLVVGITVQPGKEQKVSRAPTLQPRKLSLFVNERQNVFGSHPGYGFVLQEGAPPAPDSVRPSGSAIVLTTGQPVEVNVVNRSHEAVTVHWHGIELESFYDGVGGWSGHSGTIAPAVEPGKSFVVRMTPKRGGTFIYHTHNEEGEQLASGLYGPLIVLDPGEVRDTVTDRIFLMGSSGPGGGVPAAVNGLREPPPIQLASNTAYRFRFINIAPNNGKVVALLGDDGKPVKWRTFAKDGASLPPQQVIDIPAQRAMAPGETYDYTFFSEKAKALTLQITTYEHLFNPRVMRVPVVVK
jgi:FtsP/CotA-like multicopper oxidase with cupredoxin domain